MTRSTKKPLKTRKKNDEAGDKVRIAIAQINTIVGDFPHNVEQIKNCLREAKESRADIILFPELTLTGYPPEDLLLKKDFVKKNLSALKSLARYTKGITAVIGFAEPVKNQIYNSAALIANGKYLGSYQKMLLPNYGVFDEKRYFKEGSTPVRFILKSPAGKSMVFGITICEDIWQAEGPGKTLCGKGRADVLLNISSSPFHMGKGKERESMIRKRARDYKAWIVYGNLVGGQDELVFDGHSLIVAPDGKVQTRGNAFVEEMIFADIHIPKSKEQRTTTKSASVAGIKTYRIALDRTDRSKNPLPKKSFRKLDRTGEVYGALVLGARDYIVKNGFKKVVIGLSGGIDSALTAVIAAEALGAENVVGVLMPSPYSSQGSVDDSRELAANLGIQTLTFSIEKAMRAYDEILDQVFRGTESGIAEENLQARIRGNLLMALSNKMGWLVLTTGNKSEISVGYCTLYGDMAGGFAVIKDVPKMWVYRLSRYVNQQAVRKVIPQAIIDKEPSAELRPDQRDVDSLPPYPLLDEVLCRYVEEDKGIDSLKRLGFPLDTVEKVTRMVDRNEYKRRQGPPGIKITPKAFGRDRRLPITNHYKG